MTIIAYSRDERTLWPSGALVAEIAEASDKQAKGIEQLNNAVAEIDKVVQRTAASAEESASAAEEMRFRCDMTFQWSRNSMP
ncbi:MAG: hypothetical protein JRJ78_03935 [Deltaproteobacteria bacterium]|nr:hypothetical protein [Deltaproteobacteria bacterium]